MRPAPRRSSSTSTTGPTTSPTTRSRASQKHTGHQGHLRQLLVQRRPVRQDAPRQRRLRPHRADRQLRGEDDRRRSPREARPLADPEPEEPRSTVPQRGIRPRQPLLDPVAMGHHRHRLRPEEGGPDGRRLGRAQTAVGPQSQASFLDEARDAFGMALFALGKDPNSTNEATSTRPRSTSSA